MQPSISIVIPVKNGAATIERCLQSILQQTLSSSCEIVVIDSGSQDDTINILSRFPIRLLKIPPNEFNHGETRNLGAREARGEFVVMTVQDAYAVDDRWLERMLKHFDDPDTAGVCGQQIVPHDLDKNPLQWFRYYDEPVPRRIRFADPTELKQMSPTEQRSLSGWDNVTAMYRRTALRMLPFRRVDFMEDAIWAMDALSKGYTLVYDYSARVYHYHHEDFWFRFRRKFTILYHIRRYFGHVRVPTWLLPDLARIGYRISRRKYCPSQRTKWLFYNVRLALASWLAECMFSVVAKFGPDRLVESAHLRFCAEPPQPGRQLVRQRVESP